MLELFNNYHLIGIGEFSHGIQESWLFRIKLLKYAMKNTNKKIYIFNEMSVWQADNIMNNTYYDIKLDKFVQSKNGDKIVIENPVQTKNSAWGKLWQYMFHSLESKIFLKLIKYIRKNKNRIKLIGIDNDKLARDLDMYKIIMKNLDKNNVNFLWAHNAHVDDRKLSINTYKWIKKDFPDLKYYCGHYLRKKLKDKYCIILSQTYEGENRFNGYCSGYACENRIFQLKYIYKKFKYMPNKKYSNGLLDKFDNKLIEFSNSYYKNNKYGYQEIVESNNWNYILFFNYVHSLEPYYDY
jgi:hypothetical protein